MLIWKKSMMNKVINKFVITVVASLLITACTDKDNKNPIQKELERILPGYEGIGFTDDQEPVDIVLRARKKRSNGYTLKFLIPKAYLTRKANWRGGEQVDMEIQTGFPEYLPRPAVKNNRKKLGDEGYDEAKAYSKSGIYIYKIQRFLVK